MLSLERMLEIAEECGVQVGDPDGSHYILDSDGEYQILGLNDKCKYCEVNVEDREALIWVEGHYRIHINENNHIDSGEYPPDGTKINYCPMCGREL